jgi:lipoprotein-anchoring transpeptidase ErfK/SrfK
MRSFKNFQTVALMGACLLGLSTPMGPALANTHVVNFRSAYDAGTIVISMSQRKLYYILSDGTAIQYPVAVAKPGKEWLGSAHIQGKYFRPDWTPPAVVRHDHPGLPNLIKGGSARNPMGVAAMTLDRDEIAIHGTSSTMRGSIGTRASYGCIRMLNEDVTDLYGRVSVGAQVVMQP